MHEGFAPTPLGLVALLFKPPWIYVVITLIVLCCTTALCCIFKDALQPFLFAALDVLAFIGRGCVKCGKGLFWCCAYSFYPLKERTIYCVDSCDGYLRPYKKKSTVKSDVPSFVF
mmetsp:Transcript_2171/g.6556  ORF Transcript_2171/g.6556 Transcript_2171/m.6556 type:complete len:115 (+) Transcript_2171:200-544(+)